MPFKQDYCKIKERLIRLMLTVQLSAEQLLPTHFQQKPCCPLKSPKTKERTIETIAYCLKTMIY